ncbi:MAG: hypothetical protein OXB93_01975, partial [Cytophagales bacterium]|nr:hypothetical protein [Cytophagales bacterium]
FCFGIQRYWWGEDGDRIKYRKMTNSQQVKYIKLIDAIEDGPKFYLRFAQEYESNILVREREEEERRRRA